MELISIRSLSTPQLELGGDTPLKQSAPIDVSLSKTETLKRLIVEGFY